VLLGCGHSVFAQDCTSVQDASIKDGFGWGCGTFSWILRFSWQGSGGTHYSWGEYRTINGACLGDYTACNGQYISPSTMEGTRQFTYMTWYDTISAQWWVQEPYKTMIVCEPWEDPNGHQEIINWSPSLGIWNEVYCN
jgi:hypothetical protein